MQLLITTYKRLETLRNTLKPFIGKVNIHAYIDGGADKEVIDYIKQTADSFYYDNIHRGIKNGTIFAINQMFSRFNEFVFIQDDMEFSNDFLDFMNWGLEKFRDDTSVIAISAYSHVNTDTCYKSMIGSEAIGVWKDKWDFNIGKGKYLSAVKNKLLMKEWKDRTVPYIPELLVNSVYGKNDSFFALLNYHAFINGMYFLHPNVNKLRHITNNSTNCKKRLSKILNQELSEGWSEEVTYDDSALRKSFQRGLFKKISRIISLMMLKYTGDLVMEPAFKYNNNCSFRMSLYTSRAFNSWEM